MATILYGWDGKQIGIQPERGENPMLIYGYHEHGGECRSCVHFRSLSYNNKTYGKCDLRKVTHGAASDHKAAWPACGKYERQAQ